MKSLLMALCVALTSNFLYAQEPAKPKEIIPKEALVVRGVNQSGRSAVHTDPVEAEIVVGKWTAPKAGDQVSGGKASWEKADFNKDGVLQGKGLRGGYAYVPITVDEAGVWMLDAAGHGMVYVNGEPRAGDGYAHGYLSLPVYLRKGTNDLLFLSGRGAFRVKLTQPRLPLMFLKSDALLPDIVDGKQNELWGAVVVANASTEPVSDLWIMTTIDDDFCMASAKFDLPPLSVRKIPFSFTPTNAKMPGPINMIVSLWRCDGRRLHNPDEWKMQVSTRKPTELFRRTFVSAIDGSVQYYAVQPASALKPGEAPALFLTCHGAGVEGSGQAAAYPRKEWGHLVAPTNRRAFGFDWEDWGRLDALEVLEHAKKELGTDPRRTYLTGHSMGGHGTWHLGVTYPEKWAAIGPSAGWMSFWTYGSGARKKPDSPVQEMVYRANNGSDTGLLAHNLTNLGVYVLHGDADDNVPVGQARMMKKILETFHKNFEYHEQPKAGHWWGGAKEGGCVDWKPMFDLFSRHSIPDASAVRNIEFTTANPGVSSKYHWLEILAQTKPLELSSVKFNHDPDKRLFEGVTNNVARLSLDLAHLKPNGKNYVILDKQELKDIWPEGTTRIILERKDDGWRPVKEPALTDKGPHRYGPFRDAFRHHMVFVVGTKGSPAETAWAWAKARYDAETWYYRGNGSVDIVADSDFRPVKEKDRSIILYGNADTHGLWKELLGTSPIQVRRGQVLIGKETIQGDDLACLFLRPRPGSDKASVGVISGTGIVGMRLTDRMPIFLSGVAYPDYLICGPDMLAKGFDGIRAAGYFGLDWNVESGDFAMRK